MGELINDPFRAARLVLHLRRQGITDHGVLNVIERVRRADFVDPAYADLGDEDCLLPLPCGQTQQRPSLIASVLQSLGLEPGVSIRILLIGEDSGYMAALLSELGHHVYVVSRFHTLVQHMRQRFEQKDLTKIRVTHGDPQLGWTSMAPFHRIVIFGGLEEVGEDLLDQLNPDGFCVASLVRGPGQILTKINRGGSEIGALGPIKAAQIRPGASSVL
ncbi:MAG: hypothetical protein AAFX02_07315 [Pseudomonadota bacterium]